MIDEIEERLAVYLGAVVSQFQLIRHGEHGDWMTEDSLQLLTYYKLTPRCVSSRTDKYKIVQY